MWTLHCYRIYKQQCYFIIFTFVSPISMALQGVLDEPYVVSKTLPRCQTILHCLPNCTLGTLHRLLRHVSPPSTKPLMSLSLTLGSFLRLSKHRSGGPAGCSPTTGRATKRPRKLLWAPGRSTVFEDLNSFWLNHSNANKRWLAIFNSTA